MPIEQVVDGGQFGELKPRAPGAFGVLIEHAFGHQRHAGPGADATDNCAIAGQADNRQRLPLSQQPMLQRRPVRTALGPHEHGLVLQIADVPQRPQGGRGDQQQLFAVHRRALEVRTLDVHRHDGTVELVIERVIEQLPPGAGAQLQRYLWETLVEFRQQTRQSPGGRRLDGPDAQWPRRFGRRVDRTLGLGGEGKNFRGVGQKSLPRRADAQPSPLTQKQRDTQFGLQGLDPCRDVRRHAMQ
ncbi:hypothetical protein BSF44_53750 [Pseudomonas sp. ACN8]|nr:hypothetical protein BSF44_53750 [Pseudomonas sp. ACN8]